MTDHKTPPREFVDRVLANFHSAIEQGRKPTNAIRDALNDAWPLLHPFDTKAGGINWVGPKTAEEIIKQAESRLIRPDRPVVMTYEEAREHLANFGLYRADYGYAFLGLDGGRLATALKAFDVGRNRYGWPGYIAATAALRGYGVTEITADEQDQFCRIVRDHSAVEVDERDPAAGTESRRRYAVALAIRNVIKARGWSVV